jgi:uncharacterized protein (TIGR02147 family)
MEIYDYRDFRAFLSAHAEEQKLTRPRWSYGVWARALGLAGTASLTMVVNGQRLPGPKLAERLVRYFRFDRRAARHFRGLIALEKARKDPEAFVAMAARLAAARPGKVAYLDDADFAAIASWHCYAVRELRRLKDFSEDAAWQARRLGGRVTARECRDAAKTLSAAGVLGAASVQAGSTGMKSLAVRRYHASALEIARQALEGEPVERRTFAASTLSVRAGAVDAVRELIDRFQDELARVVEAPAGEGEEVYQLTVQFVPLTARRD